MSYDNLVETLEKNGWTVEIRYSPPLDTCRDDDCHGLFLGLPHRHYDIGDEPVPQHIIDECSSLAELETALAVEYDAFRIWPVGMIDHSGVTYYLGGGAHWCDPGGWDSGTCGFLIYTRDKLRMWSGDNWEHYYTVEYPAMQDGKTLDDIARDEIQEYSDWAAGHVYDLIVLDPNGDDVTEDKYGECPNWLIGDYAYDEARELLDRIADEVVEPIRDVRLSHTEIGRLVGALNVLRNDQPDALYERLHAIWEEMR